MDHDNSSSTNNKSLGLLSFCFSFFFFLGLRWWPVFRTRLGSAGSAPGWETGPGVRPEKGPLQPVRTGVTQSTSGAFTFISSPLFCHFKRVCRLYFLSPCLLPTPCVKMLKHIYFSVFLCLLPFFSGSWDVFCWLSHGILLSPFPC